MFQRVRELTNETGIVDRFACQVGISFRAHQKDSLRGQRAAVDLDPLVASTDQRASPEPKPLRRQSRVGHFQHNAAHVFIGEKVFAGELQVVPRARYIKEEWIAAPASEEAVVARIRYSCVRTGGNRRTLDDNLPAVVYPRGLSAHNARKVAVCRPPSEVENRIR